MQSSACGDCPWRALYVCLDPSGFHAVISLSAAKTSKSLPHCAAPMRVGGGKPHPAVPLHLLVLLLCLSARRSESHHDSVCLRGDPKAAVTPRLAQGPQARRSTRGPHLPQKAPPSMKPVTHSLLRLSLCAHHEEREHGVREERGAGAPEDDIRVGGQAVVRLLRRRKGLALDGSVLRPPRREEIGHERRRDGRHDAGACT
jgi:hypothetical protein